LADEEILDFGLAAGDGRDMHGDGKARYTIQFALPNTNPKSKFYNPKVVDACSPFR
jgi:hypothetical protein